MNPTFFDEKMFFPFMFFPHVAMFLHMFSCFFFVCSHVSSHEVVFLSMYFMVFFFELLHFTYSCFFPVYSCFASCALASFPFFLCDKAVLPAMY